eukprot:394865-Rhodomonas_salina.2
MRTSLPVSVYQLVRSSVRALAHAYQLRVRAYAQPPRTPVPTSCDSVPGSGSEPIRTSGVSCYLRGRSRYQQIPLWACDVYQPTRVLCDARYRPYLCFAMRSAAMACGGTVLERGGTDGARIAVLLMLNVGVCQHARGAYGGTDIMTTMIRRMGRVWWY